METSAKIRERLSTELRLDLIGPSHRDASLINEILPDPPSRWYLTGFLVPVDTPSRRKARDPQEEMDTAEQGGADDDETPDRGASNPRYLPSSMGLSLLVEPKTQALRVTCRWGEYHPEGADQRLRERRRRKRPDHPLYERAAAGEQPGHAVHQEVHADVDAEEQVRELRERPRLPRGLRDPPAQDVPGTRRDVGGLLGRAGEELPVHRPRIRVVEVGEETAGELGETRPSLGDERVGNADLVVGRAGVQRRAHVGGEALLPEGRAHGLRGIRMERPRGARGTARARGTAAG